MDNVDWYRVRDWLSLLCWIFWLATLVSCFQRDFGDRRRRLKWLLVLIVFNWPAAIIYWFVGRSGTEGTTDLARRPDSGDTASASRQRRHDGEGLGGPKVTAALTTTATGRDMRTRRALRRAQEYKGNSK